MVHQDQIFKPKIKVLAIDGGGIKGIIPCVILNYIRENLGLPLTSVFDLFAGTSTGGIITLGLTLPDKDNLFNKFEPSDMLNFYLENGGKIFNRRLREKRKTLKERFIRMFKRELIEEPFDATFLESLLKEKFGTMRLSDCLANVLVTSFDIQKNQTIYFLSRTAAGEADKMLWEVARSTSAAPTYFKPANVEFEEGSVMGLIDGGVFANNPSILAYCEAKELLKAAGGEKTVTSQMGDLPIRPTDDDLPIFVLSIGTGMTAKSIDSVSAQKFLPIDWAPHLLNGIFMDAVAENTHFTMQHLLPPYRNGQQRYWRLQIDDLPVENSDMCDASDRNVKELERIAHEWVEKKENKEKLDRLIAILRES